MLSRTSHSKIPLTTAHVIFYSQTKLFIFLLYGIVLRLSPKGPDIETKEHT